VRLGVKFEFDDTEIPRFADLDAEYEILRELGRGGTAVVYLARERELGREVAIKVIRSTYVEDREAAARLIREARVIAKLQHPNIVLLYGTRRLRDSSLALIMQYVPGRTLKSEIREYGPLPIPRVEQILADLGSALEYASQHGIVHRDIKPENIYLDERTGTARLSDFGIARPLSADSSLTLPGTAIGTPAYMSPEQIDGGTLDGRSDVYSLGLIGYEMLTGRPPWEGAGLYSIVYKQKHEMLPSPALGRPDIPERVLVAVEGALRKDPDSRWDDASEFLAALSGRIIAAKPPAAVVQSSGAGELTPAGASVPEDGATIQFRRDQNSDALLPATDGELPRSGARKARRNSSGRQQAELTQVDAVRTQGVRTPAAGSTAAAAVDTASGTAADRPRTRSSRVFRRLLAAVAILVLAGALTQAALSVGQIGLPAQEEPGGEAAAELAAVRPSADPEPAVAMAVSGADQQGIAGDTLAQWLVLRVENGAGEPAAGVSVQFSVASGEGVVTPGSATTDELGLAGARWLVHSAGVHAAQAAVENRPEVAATFHATVLPRPATRISAGSPTEISAASASPAPLMVRVEDDRGSPVAGATVRFAVASGGGRAVPAAAVTDSSGTAQAEWAIGTRGTQEVSATLEGVSEAVVRFRAAARSAPLRIRPGVAAGGTHTCALGSDGAAACWGGNDSGQLGDGSGSRRARPARVEAPEPLALVSAGVSHTCGVGVSGSAFCWGSNAAGQLGDGTRTSRTEPVSVAREERFTAVSVGMAHSCALDPAGRAFCWGDNSSGQLGDGSRTSRNRPTAVRGGPAFRSVTTGWAHTCALSADGQAYCWGRNENGELGVSADRGRTQPGPVAVGYRFTMLAAGNAHTCGVRTDGAIMCWGQNAYGQLGTGAGDRSAPTVVQAEGPFSTVETGGVHTCGLTRRGVALCWGRNVYGQLGDGSTDDRMTPVTVAGELRFSALHASGAHTCGTTLDGAAYCWGFNIEGQLGDRTRSNQSRPVLVDWPLATR
jgi:serine/threonine protein kinase/alpha-tubulin suppressor-like RCC1 family protein